MSNQSKKLKKKKAIFKLSQEKRCSLSVAAHIFNCMSNKNQKKMMRKTSGAEYE